MKHFTSETLTRKIGEAYEASGSFLQNFVEELIDEDELLQCMNDLRCRINVLFTARDGETVSGDEVVLDENDEVLDSLDELVQGEPEDFIVNLDELKEKFPDMSDDELIFNIITYFDENDVAMFEYRII